MSDLATFILSIVILLSFFILFKVSRLLGKRKAETLRPRYDGKNKDISLGTANGCGLSMSGIIFSFRTHKLITEYNPFNELLSKSRDTQVVYRFFTFLFVPLVPIGCYRIDTMMTHMQRQSRKKYTSSYGIYGTEKWIFWEVVSIYCVPGLIFSGIHCISSLFALF